MRNAEVAVLENSKYVTTIEHTFMNEEWQFCYWWRQHGGRHWKPRSETYEDVGKKDTRDRSNFKDLVERNNF